MEKTLELLSLVSNVMISDKVLDEILHLMVRIIAETLGFKLCSFMLIDEEKGELILKATQSLNAAYRSRPPLKVGEGISGLAMEQKNPIAIADVLKDPRFSMPDLARAQGLVSMLSIPMMTGGQSIGVLNVYTAEPHEFTQEEIAALQSVANQAAVAIERVQDALTGAYNRRYLDRGIQRYLIEDVKDTPVALILIDIDFFKIINDLHGHSFGDDALREVARCMRKMLRATDVIIRYGGDEFLLLLPGEPREGALRVLRKAEVSVARLFLRDEAGKLVKLSISGGVSVYPEDGESFRVLLVKADEELQKAKRSIYEKV